MKIAFADFWTGFNYSENYFTNLLRTVRQVEISETPEAVFYSFGGRDNEKYMNSVRFFFTGENIRPDFTKTDYAISYDLMDSERQFRWPLYNLYGIDIPKPDNSKRTEFCAVVVSNERCIYRNLFAERLSSFRKVDYGGRYRNNVGGPVKDKINFLKKYRFTLAFENASYPGYTTEKLLEAKKAGCVPIYWGNPEIHLDFNKDAFINVHAFKHWNDVIEYVLEVDADPKLFQRIQQAPLITHDIYTNTKNLIKFIDDRLETRVRRDQIYIPGYTPSDTFSWSLKYLVFDWKRILTRKISLKRIAKNIMQDFFN